MKKFTVILLIAVLAMTSVFADFSVGFDGSVTAKYDYDIDAKKFAYTTPNADVDVEFSFGKAEAAAAAGDGLSATLAANLSWKQPSDYKHLANKATIGLDAFKGVKTASTYGYFQFKVTDFSVVGKNFSLNLLSADDLTDFAVSAIDSASFASAYAKRNGKPNYLSSAYNDTIEFSTDNGVTLAWNGYQFALASDVIATEVGQKDVYAAVQTPDFNIGAGFTLQGAGAVNYTGSKSGSDAVAASYTAPTTLYSHEGCTGTGIVTYDSVVGDYHCSCGATLSASEVTFNTCTYVPASTKPHANEWLFVGSLKTGFASDYLKITAATDQALYVDSAVASYNADASFKLQAGPAADFATVDAYYGKSVAAWNTESYAAYVDEMENLFSAKVAFDFNAFGAPVKANIAGLNLFNEDRILDADAEITIAENYKIKAFAYDLLTTAEKYNKFIAATKDMDYDGEYKYFIDHDNLQKLGLSTELTFGPVVLGANVYTRLAQKVVGFGTSAVYTNNYFVADATVDAEFDTTKAAKDGYLKVTAGIESATVVKNATVGLTYDSKNILPNAYTLYNSTETKHAYGTIEAFVKVVF